MPKREPRVRTAGEAPAESLSVRTGRCPACGRPSAVVFPVLRPPGGRPAEPRLVCLECCPRTPADLLPRRG